MKRKAQRLNPRLNGGRGGNMMLGGSMSNRRNGGVYNNNGISVKKNCCSTVSNVINKQKSYSQHLKQKKGMCVTGIPGCKNANGNGSAEVLKNVGANSSSEHTTKQNSDVQGCDVTGNATVSRCNTKQTMATAYKVCRRDGKCTFTRQQQLPGVKRQLDCKYTVKSLVDQKNIADSSSSRTEKLKSKCAEEMTKTPIVNCDARYA